jgi:hypothetical protein
MAHRLEKIIKAKTHGMLSLEKHLLHPHEKHNGLLALFHIHNHHNDQHHDDQHLHDEDDSKLMSSEQVDDEESNYSFSSKYQ